MYTRPRHKAGLPYTSDPDCLVRTVFQRTAPVASDSASRRGRSTCPTGTNAVAPPGAFRSIAALPLICWATLRDHRSLPVAASSA